VESPGPDRVGKATHRARAHFRRASILVPGERRRPQRVTITGASERRCGLGRDIVHTAHDIPADVLTDFPARSQQGCSRKCQAP